MEIPLVCLKSQGIFGGFIRQIESTLSTPSVEGSPHDLTEISELLI